MLGASGPAAWPPQAEVEDMIWEVDEDCDQALTWPEFQAMYQRCRSDQTGAPSGAPVHSARGARVGAQRRRCWEAQPQPAAGRSDGLGHLVLLRGCSCALQVAGSGMSVRVLCMPLQVRWHTPHKLLLCSVNST